MHVVAVEGRRASLAVAAESAVRRRAVASRRATGVPSQAAALDPIGCVGHGVVGRWIDTLAATTTCARPTPYANHLPARRARWDVGRRPGPDGPEAAEVVASVWLVLDPRGRRPARASAGAPGVFETLDARRHHRPQRTLYHAALEVQLDAERWTVEMAPAWAAARTADHGVTRHRPGRVSAASAPRGCFRYEVRVVARRSRAGPRLRGRRPGARRHRPRAHPSAASPPGHECPG